MIGAAISTGPNTHLDHLVPICALMKIPLFVTEESQVELCQLFYPSIQVHYLSLSELQIGFFAEFDAIFYCGKFWALELQPLIELLYKKSPRFIFCPHGNSDKEIELSQVVFQDIALLYGKQMRNLMKKGTVLEMGNLRCAYYFHNRQHLDQLAEQQIFHRIDAEKKTILYAPTWETKANPSSFFQSTEALISELAKEHNLLIKLHPLLSETHPGYYWYILEKYQEHSSAFFIHDFPAIYPILQRTDLYIGDHSSIGYDFLFYDRPMFFLPTGQTAFLHRCGEQYQLEKIRGENRQEKLSKIRKRTYAYAFNTKIDPHGLRSELLTTLHVQKETAQSSAASSSSSKTSAATSSPPES